MNLSALQQAVQALFGQQAQAKAQQPAYPIGNQVNGQFLLSNGKYQDTPASQALQTVRQQAFDENYFTPEAQKYLQTLPLGYTADPEVNGQYNPNSRTIYMNPRVMNQNQSNQGWKTMTHEMLHSLDSNLHNEDYQDYPPTGYNTADSYGFYDKVAQLPSGYQESLKNFLSYYPDQLGVKDSEAFAEYGARAGQYSLLNPGGSAYQHVFIPGSKAPRKGA